jgi:hypothetical protein
MHLYRTVRDRSREALNELKRAGYHTVRIQGDGDIADVCRLTCYEQGITVTDALDTPVLVLKDMKVFLSFEGVNNQQGNKDLSEVIGAS